MKELIAGLMMVAATAAVANELSIEELNAKHGVKGRVSFAEDAKGEPIAVLYTDKAESLDAAEQVLRSACRWGGAAPERQPLIYGVVR